MCIFICKQKRIHIPAFSWGFSWEYYCDRENSHAKSHQSPQPILQNFPKQPYSCLLETQHTCVRIHTTIESSRWNHCPILPGIWEVGGWGRVPFSRNLMSPTPRRKWYLTTGHRAHGTRAHPPTSSRTFFWVSTPAPHLSLPHTSRNIQQSFEKFEMTIQLSIIKKLTPNSNAHRAVQGESLPYAAPT